MQTSFIDDIYNNTSELLSLLHSSGKISLMISTEDTYKKFLLLSIASYFESELSKIVIDFIKEQIGEKHIVVSLVQRKVIERQYHTWFDWKENNANKFFSLFGSEFKKNVIDETKKNHDLDEAIKNFLSLSRDRNHLVHQNYATCNLEKTSSEIHESYKSALLFLKWIPSALRKYAVSVESQD